MSFSHEQLNDLRKRVLDGQPYTREELAEAVRQLVGDRLSQAPKAAEPKGKSKPSPVNLDDLL